jgi:hypothetical protein
MATPDEEAGLLGWELMAMAATSHKLRNDRALRDDPVVQTALLESFLTHVRILSEFFMGRRRSSGLREWKSKADLVPQDMISLWSPPENGRHLDEALPKIDAFLSHLSRKRLDDKEAWGFIGLAETVLTVGSEFDSALAAAGSSHYTVFHRHLFLAGQVLREGPIEASTERP